MPDSLRRDFEERGWAYRIVPVTAPASRLPLKRLAVSCGLAVYGRNNITYVAGMGSFLTLAAHYSNLEPEDLDWSEPVTAKACARCEACVAACPTGAIRADRFLIDNERCLSYFNESPGTFPPWLSANVHHCVYDCLICQSACPMNRSRRSHPRRGGSFGCSGSISGWTRFRGIWRRCSRLRRRRRARARAR
ncbi:MAG: 4Fe-4S double cluster binding domain-containing protein [Spirochaetota bacterium]